MPTEPLRLIDCSSRFFEQGAGRADRWVAVIANEENTFYHKPAIPMPASLMRLIRERRGGLLARPHSIMNISYAELQTAGDNFCRDEVKQVLAVLSGALGRVSQKPASLYRRLLERMLKQINIYISIMEVYISILLNFRRECPPMTNFSRDDLTIRVLETFNVAEWTSLLLYGCANC